MDTENDFKKMKTMVESIDFTMMETNLGSKPSHIIPMSTKKVDSFGQIWFLSNKNSEHNGNLHLDNSIQLIYADKANMEFITIFGQAEITCDKKILKELYGKMDDTWFKGVDDPNLSAIKVIPSKAHYWDTKDNKLITLLKMGWGGLTGKNPDIGKEGELTF